MKWHCKRFIKIFAKTHHLLKIITYISQKKSLIFITLLFGCMILLWLAQGIKIFDTWELWTFHFCYNCDVWQAIITIRSYHNLKGVELETLTLRWNLISVCNMTMFTNKKSSRDEKASTLFVKKWHKPTQFAPILQICIKYRINDI